MNIKQGVNLNGKRLHAAVFDIYITSLILMFLFVGFIMLPLMFQAISYKECPSLFYCLSLYSFIYMLIRDNLGKRSIGKRSIGLRIIDTRTKQDANALSRFLRNMTLLIWPIDLVFLFITGSRIGDKIAGTEIIIESEKPFKNRKTFLKYNKAS